MLIAITAQETWDESMEPTHPVLQKGRNNNSKMADGEPGGYFDECYLILSSDRHTLSSLAVVNLTILCINT